MNKTLPLLLVLCLGLIHTRAQAQQGKIKGQLTDKTTKEALPAATVVLLHAKDSTVAATAISDNKGNFEISDIDDGSYRLYLSFMGYKPVYKPVTINAGNKLVTLGNIAMDHKGVDLKGVEILDEKPPIVVKKDTLEFNADVFKTRENAVVEDLLKKLPGVTVDKDGAITAQGQSVTKVLVNGKPFFGNDPKLATKNLPTNIVDKVQIIDKKSDQAEFTQIDDGQTEKAINIVVKKDKMKGMFGRATAGYGTDDRFGINMSLNRIRESQQISLLAGGNNVNNLGYTIQDQIAFSNAGSGSGGRGPGGRGGGRVMVQNLGSSNNPGITRNWNTGLNFSQDLNKKLRVSGSYFFNDTRNDLRQQSARQNFLKDSSIYYNSNSQNLTDNANHRLSARVEYQLDSSNSFIFAPTYSFTNGNSYSSSQYQTLNAHKDTINSGSTFNDGHGNTQTLSGNLLYRKRFNKPGRTLSTNITFSNGLNDQQNFNKSNTLFFNGDGPKSNTSFDQRNEIHGNSNSIGANLTYTEPVFKDRFLEVNYGITKYNNNSTKHTYDFDNVKETYNTLNDSLSNAFRNNTINQVAGLNLHTQKLKYDYTFGLNVVFNNLDNTTHSYRTNRDSLIQQRTVNFAPSASFNYTFAKNKRLRIYYSGTTQQPTVQQLQPVPDNSNPLYIQLGNPDLKPAFTNTLRANYNQFNNTTFRGMFAVLNASFITNRIINSTRLDSGVQTSKPVNVNGYYNIQGMLHNSIPLSRTPGQSLNTSTSISYGRDVNITNGTLNYTNSFQIMQGLNVNYTYKELLDVSAGGSINYNSTRYTLAQTPNTNYFDYSLNADFNVNLPLGFMIGSDVTCTMSRGRTAGYNLTSTMLNANIAKYVFPKKQGLIKLQGFDLLHQYVSVTRNVNDNYIEDVKSNVLQNYFMISFTYFLNKFANSKDNKGMRDIRMNFPRGMRGGGMIQERF
ncbi:TonB-dependent receptor [Chitinophaga vietnamensis]|uniref:TonB-dependent receptor n=1 Tax=Chitinophaga vietnamensis TaxID=2593957 RepID=UPI001375989C|nr:TonB-dependent receptor [Chitinophaga vietnamensis]